MQVEIKKNLSRAQGFFIHFFGADGVGKTTQARALAHYLGKAGIDVKLVRIRSGRTLASLMYKFFIKVDSCHIELGEDGRVIRINMMKGTPHQQIWSLIEIVSMIPWLVRGVFIPLVMGKTVIAERYIIDAIATIGYLVDNPQWSESFLAKFLLRFIPTNSIFIHLDAPYAAIAKRRNGLADPREYIEFQRKTYLEFAKRMHAITIDTSFFSLEETHKLIRQHLRNIL